MEASQVPTEATTYQINSRIALRVLLKAISSLGKELHQEQALKLLKKHLAVALSRHCHCCHWNPWKTPGIGPNALADTIGPQGILFTILAGLKTPFRNCF